MLPVVAIIFPQMLSKLLKCFNLGYFDPISMDIRDVAAIVREGTSPQQNDYFTLGDMVAFAVVLEQKLEGDISCEEDILAEIQYLMIDTAFAARATWKVSDEEPFQMECKGLFKPIDRLEAVSILNVVLKHRIVARQGHIAKNVLILEGTLFLVILVGGMFLFTGVGLNENPNPTFVDSFYFSVITASTIGLGDLVPDYNSPWRHFVWLSFLALSLTTAGNVIGLLPEYTALLAQNIAVESRKRKLKFIQKNKIMMNSVRDAVANANVDRVKKTMVASIATATVKAHAAQSELEHAYGRVSHLREDTAYYYDSQSEEDLSIRNISTSLNIEISDMESTKMHNYEIRI